MRLLVSTYNQTGELSRHYVNLFRGDPIPLHWYGWHTTSAYLYREGWEFFAEESLDFASDSHRVSLGARSPKKDMVLSGRMLFHRSALHDREWHSVFMEQLHGRGFEMNHYKATDRVMTFADEEISRLGLMRKIDIHKSGPSIAFDRSEGHVRMLRDQFRIFEYEPEGTKEIFIQPKSVDACLDMILQMQYPEQVDLKKKLIMPETRPLIQAKIFTLAA
jgi:hypothetical protein